MATVKTTQRDYFEAIKAMLNGDEISFSNEELIDFIDGRLAVLNKKSANRKTKVNEADEALKDAAMAVLANGEKMTVSAIMQADDTLGAESNQKISAILRKLITEDKVVREKDKKTTLFYAVAQDRGQKPQ